MRSLFSKAIEYLDAPFDGLFGCGVGNAEVGVTFRKDAAWDDEQILLDGRGYKLLIGAPRHLRKEVKSAAGLYNLIFVL